MNHERVSVEGELVMDLEEQNMQLRRCGKD